MKLAYLCKTHKDCEFNYRKYIGEVVSTRIEVVRRYKEIRTVDGDIILFLVGELDNIRGNRFDKLYVQRGLDLELLHRLDMFTVISIFPPNDRISFFD